MMEQHTPEEFFQPERSTLELESEKGFLWTDFTGIISLLHACFERISKAQRKKQIEKILTAAEWIEHYKDKKNGRRVLAESKLLEYSHELETAIALARVNYDVIFAPRAMFLPNQKKFDVFLIRDNIILKADLKNITSKNPDTISNRIKGGSEQAPRVVIHIKSNIRRKDLIVALKTSVERNNLVKEVLLLYNKKFYRLPKSLILSTHIFEILK